jgi:hypothetical protein
MQLEGVAQAQRECLVIVDVLWYIHIQARALAYRCNQADFWKCAVLSTTAVGFGGVKVC